MSETKISGSKISAKSGVDIIGKNQYKIANSTFNIDVSAPTYDTNLKHLEKSLVNNRESLNDDFIKLERLIKELHDLNSGHVQAVIKDILIGSRNIELLIPPIRLNGGKVSSLPNETNIVKRINDAIGKSIDALKEEKKELEKKTDNYHFEMQETDKFKFGRSGQEKRNQMLTIYGKIEKLRPRIKEIKEFLNKFE